MFIWVFLLCLIIKRSEGFNVYIYMYTMSYNVYVSYKKRLPSSKVIWLYLSGDNFAYT